MCGLSGIFNLDGRPVDPAVLQAMDDRLVHRGPDDQGLVLIDSRQGRAEETAVEDAGFDLGLASRRLAIIDLSPNGRMPMANEDRSVWLVYNGEIYNYRELRAALIGKGHLFRTDTDTEAVVHAYEEWGPGCLDRFNGMWALALFDSKHRRLFCARDRFGIKPFYYYFDGRIFVFASEIKALLVHPQVPRRPNHQAVFNYLARSYRFVDGRPTTFFEEINQINPGSYLMVSARGLRATTYWDLDPQARTELPSARHYAERFLELLDDSVWLRLRSDVPVAAQLSGGLDSSAVTVLAAKRQGPGLPTFSACYNIKPFDEREFIAPTADQVQARRNFVFPRPQDLPEVLPRMIRLFDEPICTVTFFAHWQVMQEVQGQGFKVVLNGHGADELAAGYYDHFLHHFGDLYRTEANGRLTREVEAWLANHGRERLEQLGEYLALLDKGGLYMKNYLNHFAPYEAALDPGFRTANANPKPEREPFASLLSNRLYNELRFETLPAVLKAEDRTTMAHSIESRLPFLDFRLVEYMFSVPNDMKIRHGLGKYIQRLALRGILPEKVRARKEKVGFNAPSEHWFRQELRDWVEEIGTSSSLFDRGILDRQGFEAVRREHLSGRANHYQFLWQVLNLDLWLNEYFG